MKKLILIPFFLIFASAVNSIVLLNGAMSDKRDNDNSLADCYITCWGDSLTSMGGWTSHLENLSNMTVYNGGTGGENARTILARQGGDAMLVNNIIIPSEAEPVIIANRKSTGGIKTTLGHIVTPLLQGSPHFNPCFIGDTKGVLRWTGSNHLDLTGNWEFTRFQPGDQVVIDKPTPIRTNFDINRNAPHLQIIFIGQNGGYDDLTELIFQHKLLISYSRAKNSIILGLSSGTAKQRAEYENTMRNEFGKYFISLREILSAPIYNSDQDKIINCYGLFHAGLTPNADDLDDINVGKVPQQLLIDSVHFTERTRIVIGNSIYKACKDLNIF